MNSQKFDYACDVVFMTLLLMMAELSFLDHNWDAAFAWCLATVAVGGLIIMRRLTTRLRKIVDEMTEAMDKMEADHIYRNLELMRSMGEGDRILTQ